MYNILFFDKNVYIAINSKQSIKENIFINKLIICNSFNWKWFEWHLTGEKINKNCK